MISSIEINPVNSNTYKRDLARAERLLGINAYKVIPNRLNYNSAAPDVLIGARCEVDLIAAMLSLTIQEQGDCDTSLLVHTTTKFGVHFYSRKESI